jgi:hypothetical protein
MRVSVTYQDQNGPPKKWRAWFTDEDAEESLERKAGSRLGISGSWRRLSFWSLSRPRQKSMPLLDQLIGKGTGVDEVFRPRALVERVPGDVGNFYQRIEFKNCHPRPGEPPVHSIEVKVVIANEPERPVRVRKDDGTIWEILGGAFAMEEFPETDKLSF